MQVRSLGLDAGQIFHRQDPLGKDMTTHSSTLAWIIPWTEEPGGLQSIVLQSQTQLQRLSLYTKKIGYLELTNSALSSIGRYESLGSLKYYFDMHLRYQGPVPILPYPEFPGVHRWEWLQQLVGSNIFCSLIQQATFFIHILFQF